LGVSWLGVVFSFPPTSLRGKVAFYDEFKLYEGTAFLNSLHCCISLLADYRLAAPEGPRPEGTILPFRRAGKARSSSRSGNKPASLSRALSDDPLFEGGLRYLVWFIHQSFFL